MLRNIAMVLAVLVTGIGFASARSQAPPLDLRNVVAVGTPCNYAGYDQTGSLINTNYTCASVPPSAAPQGTPTGGNCIAVSTPPAAGSIAYTCATPGPQTTPSPSATSTSTAGAPTCVFASTYPYQLVCNFPAGAAQATPSPTATATSTAGAPSFVVSGSFPYTYTVNFPANSATTAPNVLLKSSNSTWDAVALAETSARHVYPMNDSSGCTSIADAVASGATAAPSPVPLATPTTASTIVCGQPSISNDGETSVGFPGTAASGYLVIPNTVLPASGSFSLEWVIKTAASNTNSAPASSAAQKFFSIDAVEHLLIGPFNSSCLALADDIDANGTVDHCTDTIDNSARDLVYTWDTTTAKWYVNCDLVFSTAHAPTENNGTSGALGVYLGGGPAQPFRGRMAKFAVYNTALSQTKICTHSAALGL